MRTIAIVNQKGGCGKTTTAINLAATFAARGLRTLIVDMDPQSHCAAGFGVPEDGIDLSIADVLLARDLSRLDLSSLVWEVARDLHLIPSTVRLAGLEAPGGPLHQLPDRDRRLQSFLSMVANQYDRCLIDCPPTISLLTFNALRAAREAIIPVETGFFALRGAEKQWTAIQKTIQRIGRPIACHLLPTLYRDDSRLAREIITTLRRKFAGQIVPLAIPDREELREAAGMGQPVIEYAPMSDAVKDFAALADWLDDHALNPMPMVETIRPPAPPAPPAPADRGIGDASAPGSESATSMAAVGVAPSISAAQYAGGGAGSGAGGSGRAGELAARMRHRSPAPDPALQPAPATAVAIEARKLERVTPEIEFHAPEIESHVAPAQTEQTCEAVLCDGLAFGAIASSDLVAFIQPRDVGLRICVAGDFNNWSSTATPLAFDATLGVHQAIVPMAPGRFRYRLIVDGKWQADRFNPSRVRNEYGEDHSIVTVGVEKELA